jgi:hypothetical protein
MKSIATPHDRDFTASMYLILIPAQDFADLIGTGFDYIFNGHRKV